MADSQQTIFERDQWQCGVCGVALARGAEVGHPLEPTISVSDDPLAASIESVTTHRICNASSKVRDEYPPALRETAQMTYQMLEGFADVGHRKLDDESDGYLDGPMIDANLRELFEMPEPEVRPSPPLHPDEVGLLLDEACDIVRRVCSVLTWRLDDFDRFLQEHHWEEGSSGHLEIGQSSLDSWFMWGGGNLEMEWTLVEHAVRKELPRSAGLIPALAQVTQLNGLPQATGLIELTGVLWYCHEQERGFDPIHAGAYDTADAVSGTEYIPFIADTISEVTRIPRILEVVGSPVRRWLLLERLLTATYERRLVDDGGFERFDEACQRYGSEVPLRLGALIERYGTIPRLHGYELAATRWRAAGRPDLAEQWEHRHRSVVESG